MLIESSVISREQCDREISFCVEATRYLAHMYCTAGLAVQVSLEMTFTVIVEHNHA